MSNVTLRTLAPGLLAETGVTPTPIEIKHYRPLVGRTIREVWFLDCGGDPLPVLVLDNDQQVSVLCDPEGNGPGFLGIL
jgi:hypothetical protein